MILFLYNIVLKQSTVLHYRANAHNAPAHTYTREKTL